MSELVGTSQPPTLAWNRGDLGTPLGVIAQFHTCQSFSLIRIDGKKPWILDSSATSHLTGSSKHFISYLPFAGNEKIRIAYVYFASFAGKGHISSFDGLILQNLLHVSKISYNLLFISKITRV